MKAFASSSVEACATVAINLLRFIVSSVRHVFAGILNIFKFYRLAQEKVDDLIRRSKGRAGCWPLSATLFGVADNFVDAPVSINPQSNNLRAFVLAAKEPD